MYRTNILCSYRLRATEHWAFAMNQHGIFASNSRRYGSKEREIRTSRHHWAGWRLRKRSNAQRQTWSQDGQTQNRKKRKTGQRCSRRCRSSKTSHAKHLSRLSAKQLRRVQKSNATAIRAITAFRDDGLDDKSITAYFKTRVDDISKEFFAFRHKGKQPYCDLWACTIRERFCAIWNAPFLSCTSIRDRIGGNAAFDC